MLESLTKELAARSIRFGLANARREVRTTLERAGVLRHIDQIRVSDPQQRKRRVPFQNKGVNSTFLRRSPSIRGCPRRSRPLNGRPATRRETALIGIAGEG